MSYEGRPTGLSPLAKWGIVLAAAGAIGGIAYFFLKDEVQHQPKLELPSTAVIQPTPLPEPQPAKPVYEEPVPAPAPEPLPDLNQSDASVMAALKGLNVNGLVEMVIPDQVLRKFVRAVDAVDDGRIVTEYRPIASPQGSFVTDSFNVKVAGGELGESQQVEQFRISPKNYLRYTLFVQVLSALDSDAAVATYKRYYPLLDKAYQELGMNKGNFHSVLVRAIDKALSAPEASGDMSLIRPKIYFEFSDPALEKMPEVYKLMLRMGPENAAKVKASLKDIRQRLVQK